MPRPRAAAVCYRRRGPAYEFLLVRTSSGSRWTFPKGRVEKQESPSQAAAREAEEEAGVTGRVDERPITDYWFPSGGDDARHQVAAFLLEVTGQREADERFRNPTWYSLGDAKKKLARGREPPFAAEHSRVIDAAIERLSGA